MKKDIRCECQKDLCKIPEVNKITYAEVPKSYKKTNRISKKLEQNQNVWSEIIAMSILKGSAFSDSWIQKHFLKTKGSSKAMHTNAIRNKMLISRNNNKIKKFSKENLLNIIELKKHIDFSCQKTITNKIIKTRETTPFDYFIQEIKKYDDCVKYIKEKKYCKKHHDMEKCKKVNKFNDELKALFNSIKNIYKFAKLHLSQDVNNKNLWISFQGWEETLIYPCIIFDEKTKEPYLTLQVRQRDPMNDNLDKKLPMDVIKSIKNQITQSKDYPISKIISQFNFKNDMPKNKYIESNIINTSFSDEKNIIAFNNLCKEIFKPQHQTIVAVFTEIIDNDSDAKKIFFKTSNNSTRFSKFIKNEIRDFKEIIIIPFIKEINSRNKYIQLPIYKIIKDAQIEKETNDYVYEASLHSWDIPDPIKSINTFIKNQKTKIAEEAVKITHNEITKMIYEYSKKRKTDPTTSRTYVAYRRDRKVKALAIRLADKHCQLCEKIAPFFNKNNTAPFLESDHIKELKNGGLDIIENVIALCPNCHRKKTYWDNIEGVNKIIQTLKIKNKSLIDKYKNKK